MWGIPIGIGIVVILFILFPHLMMRVFEVVADTFDDIDFNNND